MKNSSWLARTFGTFGFLGAMVLTVIPLTARAALIATWGDTNASITPLPTGLTNVKAVAGGGGFSLALNADGTVVAWGALNPRNTNALLVPPGLADVTAIAAGDNHGLALTAAGRVVAWGYGISGETNVPAGLTKVTAIAAGSAHNLALRADGTVVTWGWNFNGQTNVPAGLAEVKAVASGGTHNLALKHDGTVVAWGANPFGQTNVPPGLSNVIAIAAGAYFSLGLKADGTISAWGSNSDGQTDVPAAATNVVAIAAGFAHAVALRSDGAVLVWGRNLTGQPAIPAGLSNALAIATGANHNLALVPAGPVQILSGPQSQLGYYTSNATLSVVATGNGPLTYRWFANGIPLVDNNRISGATTAHLTIANLQFSDAANYTVVVGNALGSVRSPVAELTVVSPPFITQQPTNRVVRAGTDVTFSAAAEGTPPLRYQWNFNGTPIPGATNTLLILGNAQPEQAGLYHLRVTNLYGTAVTVRATLTVTSTAPYFLRVPTNQIAVPGGSAIFSALARGTEPLRYQWRFNGAAVPGATNATLALQQLRYDQSGYYTVEVSNALGATNSPKVLLNVSPLMLAGAPFSGNTNLPLGLSNVTAVAAGGSHAMALLPDGTVRTWLANGNYLFGNPAAATNIPASATNVIAIAAGYTHCLALRSNGTVVAWGGSGTHTNVPTGLSNVVAIAAGQNRSYAVKTDGTVTGWGNAATVPAGLSNVVAVASGTSSTYALRRDGTVVVWPGVGAAFSVVPGLANVIAIASSGDYNNLALRQDGVVVRWPFSGGQLQFSKTSNNVAIASGYGSGLILNRDGTLDLSSFQRPPFAVTNNISAIAAGGVQSGFGLAVLGSGAPAFTLHPVSQIVQRSNAVQLHARAVGVQPMRYQWLRDGATLPGATNSSLTLSNMLGADTGNYQMIASNALGVAASRIATISIPFNTNLPAALNATNLQWTTPDRNIPWFAQNRVTHDGDAAGQSGATTNGGSSALQTYISTPGTLRFWWKVSSEEGFDFLRVYVDQTATPLFTISGETDWEQKTITFTNGGNHFVRWVYSKDGSVSAGRDAGFLDEVTFTPPPPTAYIQPATLIVGSGNDPRFFAVTASVVKPVDYQWLRFGTNLPGATNQTLTFPNLGRKDRGTYSVRVSNAGGSVVTSNATVSVNVRQKLGPARRAADGSLEIFSRDATGGGLTAGDLAWFEAQASTNLLDWQTLPGALSVTNGWLLLRDPEAARWPQRFYRVVEH